MHPDQPDGAAAPAAIIAVTAEALRQASDTAMRIALSEKDDADGNNLQAGLRDNVQRNLLAQRVNTAMTGFQKQAALERAATNADPTLRGADIRTLLVNDNGVAKIDMYRVPNDGAVDPTVYKPSPKCTTATQQRILVPGSRRPLSFFDWQMWPMAFPREFRIGDIGYGLHRPATQTYQMWAECLITRDELEYTLPGEQTPYVAAATSRYQTTAVLFVLYGVGRQMMQIVSAREFFQRPGTRTLMQSFAKMSGPLIQYALVETAKAKTGDEVRRTPGVPGGIKRALVTLNRAFADVLGSDAHRVLSLREDTSYTALFGPPLIFMTPNVASTRSGLVLVCGGQQVPAKAAASQQAWHAR